VILFILGLVLGAAVATALTHVYAQSELKSYSHDLALLQARLRTLVRLTEAGFIRPDTVEAASVLNEVHDLVVEARALDPSSGEGGWEREEEHVESTGRRR
jgi:hypothetical protein